MSAESVQVQLQSLQSLLADLSDKPFQRQKTQILGPAFSMAATSPSLLQQKGLAL